MNGIDEGLVLHLKLDQTTDDGHVLDTSGNENHGTSAGSIDIYDDETFGSCLFFDGETTIIALDLSRSMIGSRQFTCCFWARPYSGGEGYLRNLFYGKSDGEEAFSLNVYEYNQEDTFLQLSTMPQGWGQAKIELGQWSHVAITSDGTTVNFYLNGLLETSSPDAAFAGFDKLWIGSQVGNEP